MDSRLIAGAYSQHYGDADKEETFIDSNRLDAIARAKRLSQETNRRRKLQALRRKLEAKREERRRNNILTKRREEQRLATEKYQRSHLPPSARQSFRFTSRRLDGSVLEDALALIRGTPQIVRPMSARERVLSHSKENDNPLEVSLYKSRQYHTHLGFSRLPHHLDPKEREELMDHSLQNLTSSKTLFEQQLAHQQNLLLKQQQQSLREFNDAVCSEIAGGNTQNRHSFSGQNDQDNQQDIIDIDDSCSSIDSLNGSEETLLEYERPKSTKHTLTKPRQRPASSYPDVSYERDINKMTPGQLEHQHLQQQQERLIKNIKPSIQPNYTVNQRIAIPMNQKNGSSLNSSKGKTGVNSYGFNIDARSQQYNTFTGLRGDNEILQKQGVKINETHEIIPEQKQQVSIKQFSTDSLVSYSSDGGVSDVKLKAVSGEIICEYNHSMQPLVTETRNKNDDNQSLLNPTGFMLEHDSRALKQQTGGNFLHQQFTTNITTNIPAQISQMAWMSPSAHTDTIKYAETTSNTNTSFHPRYPSDIGTSIWPSYSTQGQLPHSMTNILLENSHPPILRSTQTTVTTTASSPSLTSATFNPTTHIHDFSESDSAAPVGFTLNKMSTFSTTNSNLNDNIFNKYDSAPLQNNDPGILNSNSNHKQVQKLSPYDANPQFQAKLQMQGGLGSNFISDKEISNQAPSFQHFSSSRAPLPTNAQQKGHSVGVYSLAQENSNYYKNQQQRDPMPISYGYKPDDEGSFPASRPPTPDTELGIKFEQPIILPSAAGTQQFKSVSGNGVSRTTNYTKELRDQVKTDGFDEEVVVDDGPDEVKPLKGILKQNNFTVKPPVQDKTNVGKVNPRDSLEIAHLHKNEKIKKKSVRFASHHNEESGNEVEHDDKLGIILTNDENAFNRPASAKVVPVTTNQEMLQKVQRSASAGPYRQQPVMSEHIQIRNVQQLSSNSDTATGDGTTSSNYNNLNSRSNLPPFHVNPLNTTPIHRPKAAAHIIMSTDAQQVLKESSTGNTSNQAGPINSHKSQLEIKIRPINNNFMSKVPVKITTNPESSSAIYNVAFVQADRNLNGNANLTGTSERENLQQLPKELQHSTNNDKNRNAYSGYKRSHLASTGIAKANFVEPAAKITQPHSNGASQPVASKMINAVFDETGLRIDSTPTDDEITWLWDKVRNCLNKDVGGKNRVYANGANDLAQKQPPVLSTKLIDGASLGLGMYHNGANSAVDGLKAASSFVYPRTTPNSNTQNKTNPAVQQQGSYLRRYGLLKQRRANSASAVSSKHNHDTGRSSSVVYGLSSTVQPHQPPTTTVQPQPSHESATLMAFSYKPQDEVSESTAAFIMAERLAKQSLSDSHIQMAMEDAQGKQETYNRSRMTAVRDKHSALSLEEQKLMESLDRLNERLKENQPYKGAVYYQQPPHPQMSGFQGHRPIIDMKRHMLLSPRTPQRAQSARIRQQTYQYR